MRRRGFERGITELTDEVSSRDVITTRPLVAPKALGRYRTKNGALHPFADSSVYEVISLPLKSQDACNQGEIFLFLHLDIDVAVDHRDSPATQ